MRNVNSCTYFFLFYTLISIYKCSLWCNLTNKLTVHCFISVRIQRIRRFPWCEWLPKKKDILHITWKAGLIWWPGLYFQISLHLQQVPLQWHYVSDLFKGDRVLKITVVNCWHKYRQLASWTSLCCDSMRKVTSVNNSRFLRPTSRFSVK